MGSSETREAPSRPKDEPEPYLSLRGLLGRPAPPGGPPGQPAPRKREPQALGGPAGGPWPTLGIRGDMGAGKDTLAAEICRRLPQYSVWKFATGLRESASLVTDIPAARTVSDADKAVDLSGRRYQEGDLLARLGAAIRYATGAPPKPGVAEQMFAILVGRPPRPHSRVTISGSVGSLLGALGSEVYRDFGALGALGEAARKQILEERWARARAAVTIIADVPADRTVRDADQAVSLAGRWYEPLELLERLEKAVAHIGPDDRDTDRGAIAETLFEVLTGRPFRPPTVALAMTVGRLLQLLGTECFRDLVGENVWVDFLFRRWNAEGCPPVVVADTRFPNESAAVRRHAGAVVLVVRQAAGRADGRSTRHASERALDGEPSDITLPNDDTVEALGSAFAAAWPVVLRVAAARGRPPAQG